MVEWYEIEDESVLEVDQRILDPLLQNDPSARAEENVPIPPECPYPPRNAPIP